jgi:hypothetical protein
MSIMLDTASPVGARVQLRLQAAAVVGGTCITWPDKGVARRHGRQSATHRNARNSTAQDGSSARPGNRVRDYKRGVCIFVCLCLSVTSFVGCVVAWSSGVESVVKRRGCRQLELSCLSWHHHQPIKTCAHNPSPTSGLATG